MPLRPAPRNSGDGNTRFRISEVNIVDTAELILLILVDSFSANTSVCGEKGSCSMLISPLARYADYAGRTCVEVDHVDPASHTCLNVAEFNGIFVSSFQY